MNKLFYILAFLMVSSMGMGQVEKGDIFINPSLSISHRPSPWDTRTGYALAFDMGFFATDHLMLGFGLSSRLNYKGNWDSYGGIRSLLRYYYWQKDKHSLFLHNQFSYQARTFSSLLGLGWNLALNQSIALESLLSYQHALPKSGDNYAAMALEINLVFFLNKSLRAQYETWPSPLSQGNWMIGGSMALFGKDPTQTQIEVHPKIGYFLSDRLVAGARIRYASIREGDLFPIQLTIWEATPFFRFFVSSIPSNVFAFLGASVGHYAQTFLGDDAPETAIQAAAELGFGFMVSPYVAFDLRLEYQSIGRLAENRNWNFDFGFQYFLTP